MASTDGPDAGRTKAQPTRAHTPAASDEADTGRTKAQPTRAQAPSGGDGQEAAGADSLRGGKTLPQGTALYLGPKQGLPQVFGRYRVQKLLGGGGMGAVYLVVNTELEREEALKVPHFDAADDPQVRERFIREAKAAAGLDHPNLCPVYDVGVLDGIYYLTMRYLKGKLLSEYSGTAQPPRKAVEIVTKLAQALTAAHAKGVIHRDLKPNNVMMCAGVGPVVMDFGLAKQTGRQDRTLTRLGTTLGTPSYMPPEQVKGDLDRMGPHSDVYSLGVILFELLTGRLPFIGRTAEEVYGKILSAETPAPSSLQPGLPAALDAACAKAMAKVPEGRYTSMKEFAAALIDYLKATAPAEGAGDLKAAKVGPADIFLMPTVASASAKTPLRQSGILAAPTQAGSRRDHRPPSPVPCSGPAWEAGSASREGATSTTALTKAMSALHKLSSVQLLQRRTTMTPEQVLALGSTFAAYLREFEDCFVQDRTREHLHTYCRGLLSDLPRKSVEPIALAAGTAVRTLQEFLRDHTWNHDTCASGCNGAWPAGCPPPMTSAASASSTKPARPRKAPRLPASNASGAAPPASWTTASSPSTWASPAASSRPCSTPTCSCPRPGAKTGRCREAGLPDTVVDRPKRRIALEQLDRQPGQRPASGLVDLRRGLRRQAGVPG